MPCERAQGERTREEPFPVASRSMNKRRYPAIYTTVIANSWLPQNPPRQAAHPCTFCRFVSPSYLLSMKATERKAKHLKIIRKQCVFRHHREAKSHAAAPTSGTKNPGK
jgi:hypothetical protein